MGAILAIMGEAGDPELPERLEKMIARSPYRGEATRHIENGIAIAIQARGNDASLAVTERRIIAFHGYIGNWTELAAERSWSFEDTATDAEKLSIALDDLGEGVFAKLRGGWAVLSWNRQELNLLCVRDFMGQRSIHFQPHQGRSYLGSEIRQVLVGSGSGNGFCWEFGRRFLKFASNPDLTAVEGVFRVTPGRLFTLRGPSEAPSTECFLTWSGLLEKSPSIAPMEAPSCLRHLVQMAVERSVDEGPVGVCVSGGLDSSAIWTAIESTRLDPPVRPIPISLRFPESTEDEKSYIDSILAETQHERFEVSVLPSEIEARLLNATERVDTLCLTNIVTQAIVSETTFDLRPKHFLTGHAGDFLFTGSRKAVFEALVSRPNLAILNSVLRSFALNPRYPLKAIIRKLCQISRRHGDEPVADPQEERFHEIDIDRDGWFLEPWEQIAESYQTEVRHPLLDLDLVAFCVKAPPEWHLTGGLNKGLLRTAFRPEWPNAIARRRTKAVLDDALFSEVGRPVVADDTDGAVPQTSTHRTPRGIAQEICSLHPGIHVIFHSILNRTRDDILANDGDPL